MRAFRTKLADVNAELKKEKARADEGAKEWIERSNVQAKELIKFKNMNEALLAENEAVHCVCFS